MRRCQLSQDHTWQSAFLEHLGFASGPLECHLASTLSVTCAVQSYNSSRPSACWVFFYDGLEPAYFWWELLVKRIDVLAMLLVAHTLVLEDPRAKLIAYLGISGFSWVFHTACLPFDCRQCMLVDRTESLGLMVRFSSFFLLVLAIIVREGLAFNTMIALSVLGANGFFILRVYVIVISETFDADDQIKKSNSKFDKAQQLFSNFLNRIFGQFTAERHRQEDGVPVFVWNGRGEHGAIYKSDDHNTHINKQRCWLSSMPLYGPTQLLYHTDNAAQLNYGLQTMCNMIKHVITHGRMSCWPSTLFDVMILLPIAIKNLQKNSFFSGVVPSAESVVDEICGIIRESASKEPVAVATEQEDAAYFVKDRTFERHTHFAYAATACDLSEALLYLQSMTKDSIANLFNAVDHVDRSLKKERTESGPLLPIEGVPGSNNSYTDVSESAPAGKESLLQNIKFLELQRSDPEFASQVSEFIQDMTVAIIDVTADAEDRQSVFADIRQRHQVCLREAAARTQL